MATVRKTFQLVGAHWSTQDPFLFIAHHNEMYPKGDINGGIADRGLLKGRHMGSDFSGKDGFSMYHGTDIPGFPKHPHCGFETVTLAEVGLCDHSDSLGCGGRFGNGDVQWMTAGAGVQHAEMFPLRNTKGGNPLDLFQIWCNLPRRSKKAAPHYAMLWAEDMSIHEFAGGSVKTIADHTLTNIPPPPPASWAAEPNNFVDIKLYNLDAKGEYTIDAVPKATPADGITRSLFFFEGSQVDVAGQSYTLHTGFELDPLQPVTIKAASPARLLLLQGRAIREPVAQHGPFVGNTHDDISAAMQDYRKTQWGGWKWPSDGPVHALDKGRFAQYADGTSEDRS
ncbi:Pirin-like protein [Diplonema papillatum]|nr:Pirin-like protein [Diplonema papillatum]